MSTLLNAPDDEKLPLPHVVEFFTAAAPPPEAVLAGMKQAGFNVTHLYGLTETYGPAVVNDWKVEWDSIDLAGQATKKARQGVRYLALEALDVIDPETMQPVPADGETMGEVMFRGNVVMKGYLKNPKASKEAFTGGWFHSGDLGVKHPDLYVQLKDRSKDIIITGQIKALLIDAKDLQSNAFKVITERGVVYLMGRVTAREAQRAAEIASKSSIGGVMKVVRVFETITEEELKRISAQPLTPQAQPKI